MWGYVPNLFFVYFVLDRYVHALQWHHNGFDCVSNHRRLDCVLNRLFRCRSKKISKLRVTGLWGEFTSDRWIPRTKGQEHEKYFHLMTSSWVITLASVLHCLIWHARQKISHILYDITCQYPEYCSHKYHNTNIYHPYVHTLIMHIYDWKANMFHDIHI